MRDDIFLRLPAPTALLLAASVLAIATNAHALPRATPTHALPTVPFRALDVVNYPQPTAPPRAAVELLRLLRRQELNTVCGYINGDPNLAATCLAGSHCVLDANHGAVGCCPDGQDTCTAGVFTGCVDPNSDPQTEINPYVYTCSGSNVCYKNVFADGYFQYGCGSASSLGATVAASTSGASKVLDITSIEDDFTASATSLATPTTIGSKISKTTDSASRDSSRTSTRASTKTAPSSRTATNDPTSTTDPERSGATDAASTDSAAPEASGAKIDRTGAIVGGTISGVAVLIALLGLGFYLWRRRKGNMRSGPGTGPTSETQYISPMNRGPGGGFAPIHSSNASWEQGLDPETPSNIRGGVVSSGQPEFHHPTTGPVMTGAAARTSGLDSDQVPLTQQESEMDEFSRGFNHALGRIGEDDAMHYPQDSPTMGANSGAMAVSPASPGRGTGVSGFTQETWDAAGGNHRGRVVSAQSDERPLWQQNRRQSRNLMWM